MVLFSNRSFVSLKYELSCFTSNETGGIFLGLYEDNVWQIFETIFPGPNAIHTSASFTCDLEYVSYQANKLANIYAKKLSILGLWHSHITSSPFSQQDTRTNLSFAALNYFGAISMLIDAEKKDYSIYSISKNGDYHEESKIIISKNDEECCLDNSHEIRTSLF